ncbi:MAG: outer membrane protein assembly factor BamA [Flavobacteriales bacterium TMED84]|nr:MAG: outer membrane protein assembly factor BamA [Flavobacteriales bacterium TMED84]
MKKEKEDLAKQLKNITCKELFLNIVTIVLLACSYSSNAQNNEIIDYSNKKSYTIEGIDIVGLEFIDESNVIKMTELEVGKIIDVPGDLISESIKKLWDQNLFSDIKISASKIDSNRINLEINLTELPRLSKFKFEGKISKSDISSLKEDLKLISGSVISKNTISNSSNIIKNFYISKGFYSIKIESKVEDEKQSKNSKVLVFKIDKGKKVKIKNIEISGRKKILNSSKKFLDKSDSTFIISDSKFKRLLKETKEKKWWRFFKLSKYIEENFENDKSSIIKKYNELGYRDAKISFDTILINDDNTISIDIKVDEGEKYFFGSIFWIGNKIYSNDELSKRLSIMSGDIYNQTFLEEKLFGNANGDDISSLYLDDGYLFFNASPSEIVKENNYIDLNIKLYEGDKAKVNKVNVIGNSKTNDHVIMREIRTKPGDLFKRSDIMRSQRELNNLQYFDPEKFDVKIEPNQSRNTVDITYVVSEKSTDQINLQGGWGAGRVVGSLGFRFTNFSSKKFFTKEAWRPLPSGDGQTLSISASSNGIYYQNYNLTFVEPWLGGKKPNSLSVSAYKSISSNGQTGNDRQSIEITGVSLGLGKRLKIPDDYFTLYNGITFQRYDLNNSQSFFSFNNGYSNNFNLNVNIGRNSIDQLIYPRSGSKFNLSLKLTPPYSLFSKNEDFANMTDQERFKWVEYYKWKFTSSWFSAFNDKLVLNNRAEMGLLGAYNSKIGVSPFERFYVGGDGLSGMGYVFDGRELISLRGYSNNSVSPQTGGTIYTKYTSELRYALSLNPTSTVYVLAFLEGGNSWDNFDFYNPFEIKKSAGFGVRIMLPMVGMMGIDYGWGFDDILNNPDANGGQFHFSIGQQF